MSRKYFDRLLTGSGETQREVKSKFGEKMMAKFGWAKGDGLGKKMDGITACIQIKRRDEDLGLGAENDTPASTFKWNDQFWDTAYNKAAESFKGVEGQLGKAGQLVADDSSSDDSDSEVEDRKTDKDLNPHFKGKVIILKASKRMFLAKEDGSEKQDKKEKKVEKLDKSKKIKKDKKEKKKSKK